MRKIKCMPVLMMLVALFVMVSFASAAEHVTIKFWTWYPEAKYIELAIEKFEELHPDIKIELTTMDSKNLQEKVPLALATDEDVDVVGVQAGAMANQIGDFLADLEPMLSQYIGDDWAKSYSNVDIESSKATTGGVLKMLSLCRFGAMIGYYNAKMFADFGLTVPTTIEEYKAVADAITAKDSTILPASFNGKDAWTIDEMMLTVMGQTSDYYNKWLYEGASVDDPHYINAMLDFKKFFDLGIFSQDVMDFDYGRAQEVFTQGKAATYFQGSWEGWLISSTIREERDVALEDVGIFALPVVQPDGKASLRSFLDGGAGIVKATKYPKEAAEWLAFYLMGEGAEIMNQAIFIGTPSKSDAKTNTEMFTSQAAQDGLKLMNELVGNPTADRNNVSAYSDIEGAAVQRVLLGISTAEDEAKALQREWTSGKYAR